MRMNLKVRMKNPVFWMTFGPAVIACAYTVLGCFGIVPAISENELTNVFTTIVTALTTLGVLVDPTTNGLNDSDRAMTYTTPQ